MTPERRTNTAGARGRGAPAGEGGIAQALERLSGADGIVPSQALAVEKGEGSIEGLRAERDRAGRAAYRRGLPMAAIARVIGISHQRVSQIVRS